MGNWNFGSGKMTDNNSGDGTLIDKNPATAAYQVK